MIHLIGGIQEGLGIFFGLKKAYAIQVYFCIGIHIVDRVNTEGCDLA